MFQDPSLILGGADFFQFVVVNGYVLAGTY